MSVEKNKFIVFGSPLIEEDEIAEVVNTLKSGWIGTGPKVTKFEELTREYVGAKYSVALASCTAALHLSLLAHNIGAGDEVITTPLTFCATVNSIIHAGATPVFADIDKNTMNIDENKIEEAITKKTKAIIPVHFAGRPCNMDAIIKIAKKHNLIVIEDAAHALGAEYKGKKIGAIGDTTCFSFYVTKNIVTAEGGMVTTNNKEIADKIKIYGLHGMSQDAWRRYSDKGYKHYEVVVPGYKYNMTDIQASLGMHQIQKIGRYDVKRKQIWDYYNENLRDLPITLPAETEPNTHHAMHLYTILVDKDSVGIDRDEFMQKLFEKGIGTGVHFSPVHLHKYYRDRFGYKDNDFPNAEYVGARTLSIPFSAKLSMKEASQIAEAIKEIILSCSKI